VQETQSLVWNTKYCIVQETQSLVWNTKYCIVQWIVHSHSAVDQGVTRTALTAGNLTLTLLANEDLLHSLSHSPSTAITRWLASNAQWLCKAFKKVDVAVLRRAKCHKFELLFEIRVESFCQQMDHSMIILSLCLDGVGLASVSLFLVYG
jgi:hypothetical protein